MKIRSVFLPLIASGVVCFSGHSLAVSTASKLVKVVGLSMALTSNNSVVDATRGESSVFEKSNLRKLKGKKTKCSEEITISEGANVCEDFCTNAVPKGTQLKSCTDSEAVNTYTCTYEEDATGSSCLSCPTDDETGLWFERKNIASGDPCMVTCEYSDPDRPNDDDAECASLCIKRHDDTDLSLTDCSLEVTGENEKFLVCEYEGVKEGVCSNCPTDSDVGFGYWFKSKATTTDGPFCKATCRYINDKAFHPCWRACAPTTEAGIKVSDCDFSNGNLFCEYYKTPAEGVECGPCPEAPGYTLDNENWNSGWGCVGDCNYVRN